MKNERAGGRWLGRGRFVAKRNLREFRLSPGKSASVMGFGAESGIEDPRRHGRPVRISPKLG
jgi:hypothetical protein